MTTPHDFRVQRPATTMRRSVTESIRHAIAVGHFKSGDRMPEKELCEMTGVSRTLVREALRQLESEGLIQLIDHKGPIVAIMTASQAAGVYQLREVLEGLAAKLFAQNATTDQLTNLETAFAKVRQSYQGEDIVERLSAKNRFYECLAMGSGNEALGEMLHMINARAMILRGLSLQQPARSQASLQELADVISALHARDPERAEELAIHHVRNAAKVALATFADGQTEK